MVERADDTLTPMLDLLDQDQPERRVDDGEVRVPGMTLGPYRVQSSR
jgi:hypothetical protein